MFFIFGLRTSVDRLGVTHEPCPNCRQSAAQVVTRHRTRFTLFFVPLIPIRTRHQQQCTWCGAAYYRAAPQPGSLVAG